MREVEK